MCKVIVFALALSMCPPGLNADKKHDAESVLVMVDGCLTLSTGDYVLIDDTGTVHTLIGNTPKLSHYVRHRVQIIGEPTVKTVDATQTNVASSVEETSAIRVQSGRQIGGRCDR